MSCRVGVRCWSWQPAFPPRLPPEFPSDAITSRNGILVGRGYITAHTETPSSCQTFARGPERLAWVNYTPSHPPIQHCRRTPPSNLATNSCTVFCFRKDQVRSEGGRNSYLLTPSVPRGRTIGCPCATNTCPMRISTERDP